MPLANDIVLIGLMGSGKTCVGRALAAQLEVDCIDLDDVIEGRAGMTIAEIFAAESEAGFRVREKHALTDVLGKGRVIATGGGAVLDADNRARMSQHATCVWLDAPVAHLVMRLQSEATKRPLLAGHDLTDRLQQLDDARRPLYQEVAHLHLDTGEATPAMLAARIVEALGVLQ